MSVESVSLKCPRCGTVLPANQDKIVCQQEDRMFAKWNALIGDEDKTDEDEIVCHNCNAKLRFRRSPSGSDAPAWRLQPYICRDDYTGMPAFRILMPEGWQFQGGISWMPHRPALPVQVAFQVANPLGWEAFEVFPAQYFTWFEHPQMQMLSPPGSFSYGSEVRPPVNAQQAIYGYLLPRCRNIPGLEVVRVEPAPDLVEKIKATTPLQPNMPVSHDGVKLRVRYFLGNQPILEEIVAVVEYVRTKILMGWGYTDLIGWSIKYAIAYRATPDRLDALIQLYQTMHESLQPNQQWVAAVNQIGQHLVQNKIQQINQIGALARQIGQQYSQIGDAIWQGYQNRQTTQDQIWQSWQQRQDSMDRITEKWSQAIRSVEDYCDPT